MFFCGRAKDWDLSSRSIDDAFELALPRALAGGSMICRAARMKTLKLEGDAQTGPRLVELKLERGD
jgi:hypothetical protein